MSVRFYNCRILSMKDDKITEGELRTDNDRISYIGPAKDTAGEKFDRITRWVLKDRPVMREPGDDSDEIGADIYIDDKAMRVEYTEAESTFWDGLFENVAGRVDDN